MFKWLFSKKKVVVEEVAKVQDEPKVSTDDDEITKNKRALREYFALTGYKKGDLNE